jgi:RNA polymerase sigma-70 factor (ECF subfamily)
VRTWLYRIATNRCLNALRSARRRAAKEWDISQFEVPEPSRLGEVVWLEPYPDALLAAAGATAPGPEARYEQTEAISLAFIGALQMLPARQRAVLILREVLGYRAAEVAGMLDCTEQAVNSALKRARTALRQQQAPANQTVDSPEERTLVARFVRAYQSGDVEALLALLTEDVVVSMPPVPLEYHGLVAVARFYRAVMPRGRGYDLVPTRANGQPAFGAYLRRPGGGPRPGVGLLVLTLDGPRISGLTRFDAGVLPWFGMPRSLG